MPARLRYIRLLMMTRKLFLTAVYSVLLVMLYIAIFTLSGQDGETSGDLSMKLSGKCTEVLGNMSGGGWNSAKMAEMAKKLEHPLRKMAHFTEYALMSVLVWLLWSLWLPERKTLHVIPVLWVFGSAILDEFHQSFVPGRHAGFDDVCVDTLGGIAGLVFILLLHKCFCRER